LLIELGLKFNSVPAKLFFYTIIIMVGFVFVPLQNAFAFWTFLDKEGNYPQHQRITDLIRWPQNHLLFRMYGQRDSRLKVVNVKEPIYHQVGGRDVYDVKEFTLNGNNQYSNFGQYSFLGLLSEVPDGGKDIGHGNEEMKAQRCYNNAINHYKEYRRMDLKPDAKAQELWLAAHELGAAYHYFADVGDFTNFGSSTTGYRREVSRYLDQIHIGNSRSSFYNNADNTKRMVGNQDTRNIIKMLTELKLHRSGRVRSPVPWFGLCALNAYFEIITYNFIHDAGN